MIKLTAKIAVFTIGARNVELESIMDKTFKAGAYAGKYSKEDRLLADAKRGLFTHVLVSHIEALEDATKKELEALKIIVMTFKDLERVI